MNSQRKSRNELTFVDFETHPIWTLYDDDGDDMVPVQYPGWTTEAVGGETMLVACEFTLNDGTLLPGVVGINLLTKAPYSLEFPRADGSLMGISVNNGFENDVTREELARFLKKTISQVFPLQYTTPFVMDDGRLLVGRHE